MLRPSRSIDDAATISILRAVAAFSSRSKADRLSRPFAPLTPLTLKTSTTFQLDRRTRAAGCRLSGHCWWTNAGRSRPVSWARSSATAIRNQVVCVHGFETLSGFDKARFFAPSADAVFRIGGGSTLGRDHFRHAPAVPHSADCCPEFGVPRSPTRRPPGAKPMKIQLLSTVSSQMIGRICDV